MARIKVEQHESRKDVIVAKAAKLFKEKGYKATSMRDLADAVGIEAASLYNHIKSKHEILHTVCFEVAKRFMTNIDAVVASNETALNKLEQILTFHIRQMIDAYEEAYVSDREWRHLSEPHLAEYRELRRVYRRQLTALIEEGIQAGEIKNIDAPTAVLILLHAIGGIESWHRSKQKIDAKELEENMLVILISGIKK
jgi:TetR/AcrR family transcriptional regulator, cholesterol catabolism regulator